jgi:hypothetical protein
LPWTRLQEAGDEATLVLSRPAPRLPDPFPAWESPRGVRAIVPRDGGASGQEVGIDGRHTKIGDVGKKASISDLPPEPAINISPTDHASSDISGRTPRLGRYCFLLLTRHYSASASSGYQGAVITTNPKARGSNPLGRAKKAPKRGLSLLQVTPWWPALVLRLSSAKITCVCAVPAHT